MRGAGRPLGLRAAASCVGGKLPRPSGGRDGVCVTDRAAATPLGLTLLPPGALGGVHRFSPSSTPVTRRKGLVRAWAGTAFVASLGLSPAPCCT